MRRCCELAHDFVKVGIFNRLTATPHLDLLLMLSERTCRCEQTLQ